MFAIDSYGDFVFNINTNVVMLSYRGDCEGVVAFFNLPFTTGSNNAQFEKIEMNSKSFLLMVGE